MDEYLKAIKTVHQLLILASAATLVFALTPDQGTEFKRADSTLRALEGRDAGGWDEYVNQLQILNQRREDQYLNHLASILDPTFSPQTIPIFAYSDLRYPLNGTLSEINQYLRMKQTIQFVSFTREADVLIEKWKAAMPTISPGGPAMDLHLKIKSISVVPSTRFLPLTAVSSDREAQILVSYYSTSPAPSQNPIALFTTYEMSTRSTEQYALAWLRSGDAESERASEGSVERIFPSLSPFWDEISNLTVSHARDKLRSQQDAQRRKVSLFGLSVESDSTVQVMPWLICSFLVFMIANLRQALANTSDRIEDTASWMGLFNDWVGRVVTILSIVVLPPASVVLLIARYGESANLSTTQKAGVLTTTGLLSIWSFIESLRLRRLHDSLITHEHVRSGDKNDEPADAADDPGDIV